MVSLNKPNVAILITTKVYFRARSIRDLKTPFVKVKVSILNLYTYLKT